MLYLSPCVNTSRLISRGISRINPRWHARGPCALPKNSSLCSVLARNTGYLSPIAVHTPAHTVRPTRARSRARWYERDTLARSLAAPSLAPAGCVRRRPTPTSDCTLLSFHIEQLTVAAAGRNSGMRNISPCVPCVPLPWRRAGRPLPPSRSPYAELYPVDP